jgi:hypothetical protein
MTVEACDIRTQIRCGTDLFLKTLVPVGTVASVRHKYTLRPYPSALANRLVNAFFVHELIVLAYPAPVSHHKWLGVGH